MMSVVLYAGHVGHGADRQLIHAVLRDGVAIAEVGEGTHEVRVSPLRRITSVEDEVIRRFCEDLILGSYTGGRGEVLVDTHVYVTIGDDK